MSSAHSDVLDRLYAAPFDASALSDALRAIGRLIGAQSLNARLVNARTREPVIVAVHGDYHSDPAIAAAYFGHWVHHDSHLKAAVGGAGRIVSDDELVSPEAAIGDPFINEFYIPSGCGPMIGWVDARADWGTVFGAIRVRGSQAYQDETRRVLADIQPHLDRALRLVASAARRGLTHDELTGLHTLEGLAFLRCRGDGQVLLVSPGAETVLAGSRAVSLAHAHLVWREPENERRFARMCLAAASRKVGEDFGFVARDGDNSWLRVAAAPAPGGDAVLVRLRILRPAANLNPERLRALFGLSPAEARVAVAVAAGAGLPEIAGQLDVTHATVRSQLRAVFEKTGTRRQSELAALIARLA